MYVYMYSVFTYTCSPGMASGLNKDARGRSTSALHRHICMHTYSDVFRVCLRYVRVLLNIRFNISSYIHVHTCTPYQSAPLCFIVF